MKRIFAELVFLSAIGLLQFVARGEPLRTEYPKPAFANGPVAFYLRNMEPPHANHTWDYDLPSGCTNLAARRPVASNDSHTDAETLAKITNGDKSSDDECVVELISGARWIQIDLGKESEIYAILVWRDHAIVRAYKGVVVQLSNDATFSNGVTTVFNADCDNLNGQGAGKDFSYIETNYGKLFDAKGAKARYVRLWSNGNTKDDLNRYVEVEVWGR